MKRLVILILAIFTPTRVLGGDGGSGPVAEPARIAVLAEFNIEDRKQLLVVPVMFQGQSYPFCIDTGASHMVYDKILKTQLGPSTGSSDFSTASGKVMTKWYDAPEATLGALSLRTDEPVTCADLAFTEQNRGKRVYGMIGMSFLRKYALTLDYVHDKIQLSHEAAIDEVKAIPIRFDHQGSPLIDVTLPGEPVRAYELDTGSYGLGGTKVDQATYDRLLRGNQVRLVYPSLHMDLSGKRVGRIAELRQAQVAGIKLSGVHVSDSPQETYRLGLDAISRLNLVLDFPRQKMTVARVGWW